MVGCSKALGPGAPGASSEQALMFYNHAGVMQDPSMRMLFFVPDTSARRVTYFPECQRLEDMKHSGMWNWAWVPHTCSQDKPLCINEQNHSKAVSSPYTANKQHVGQPSKATLRSFLLLPGEALEQRDFGLSIPLSIQDQVGQGSGLVEVVLAHDTGQNEMSFEGPLNINLNLSITETPPHQLEKPQRTPQNSLSCQCERTGLHQKL